MSRCFPFPPPGYEKKARTDDADLLEKEKNGEKKHKKERKDKEEREGKEKREKDRSDGKHRGKKDRKEKHREKKKDKEKERDKDKDKISTSEEKRIAGLSGNYNGEKVNQKEKERNKDKSSVSDEKKQTLHLQGHGGEKPIRFLSEGTGDSKFVQELGRRIRDEEKGSGSQLVERLLVKEWKNDERMDRVVVKDTGVLVGGKEKNNNKRVDNRKINGQGTRDDAISSGGAMVQNNARMLQPRVEGMSRPMEKNIERRMEEKEKSKEREGDDKRGDKRKNKDAEKKSHGKDKEREKEKKKEEKVKEKSEHKNEEQEKFNDTTRNANVGTRNIKTSHIAKDGDRNTDVKGNLKKRKDLEVNGFLHDTDVRPNKMPRPSTHPSTENGRKLEPCLTSILFTSDRHEKPNNLKVDSKEHKVNGVIQAQPLSVSKKSSSASKQAHQLAQASMKPPHRDSKYLGQVLSVPKMEEWSGFDDQEWLFSSKGCLAEKPSVGSAEVPMVWAEALQIESADVCALPYVIPY